MNRFIGIGNLTKDPELKYTSSNLAFCNFTIAINDGTDAATGESRVEFIDCTTWRKNAENLARFQSKGSKIAIEGRLEKQSWEADDGSKRYASKIQVHSIEYLSTKSDQNQEDNPKPERSQKTPRIDVQEDDLPF